MPIFPRRLNAQLILLVSCILLATGVTSGWVTAGKQSNILLSSMRGHAAIMVRNLGETCAHYLVLREYAGLESFLRKSAELPDIARLQVCEPDGVVIGDVERAQGMNPRAVPGINRINPPPLPSSAISIENGTMVIWQPIQAGSMLGWIKATYSMAAIHEAQAEAWKNSLLLALFWVVCSVVLLLFMLRPTVQAIGRLTAFARRLDERKGDTMVVAHRTIEIEELGASLNYASSRLFSTEQQLIREREMLKEQYSTLRGILESADALIFSVDRQYRYTTFNTAHASVMRAIYGAEIQVGRSLLDYMTVPEDREQAKQNLDRTLGGEHHLEFAYSGEDIRSRRYFEVSHSPIMGEGASVIGVAVLSRDITERKQAEEALRRSEEKYRTIFEESFDGLFITSPAGKILDMNRKGIAIFGYETKEEIQTLDLAKDIYANPADRQRILDMVNVQGSAEYEVEVRKKSGETIIAHCSLTAVKDEMNRPVSYRGIIRDITERKRADKVLQRLNRELRAISTCNQVLVRAEDEQTLLNDICRIICDEAGYRMAWVGYAENDNARTVRTAARAGVEDGFLASANITWADGSRGRGPTGIAIRTGRTDCIQDFATEPKAAPWRDSALQRGYRSSIALPLKDENKNTFGTLTLYSAEVNAFTPDEIRLLEELSGDLAFGIMVLRARNERKRAEDSLLEREAFIRNILESVDEGFIVVDREFRILSANKAFCRLVKVSEAMVAGLPCYKVSHHVEKPCFEMGEDCAVKRTFETGTSHSVTHTHMDTAGAKQYVEIKSYPITDASGKVVSAIQTVNDITEKRKLEDQLRQAQKMEAIGTLAGGVAHDFNNILTAIIGYGNIVKMKMKPDDPQRASIDQILAASERAAHLTQGLLAFSRKQIINPRPVEVNGIIKSVEKLLRRLIGEDVDLTTILAARDLMIMADSGQIEQVLMNLATNARDAMPDGGTLTITTKDCDLNEDFVVMHGSGKAGRYALIAVADTGLGMDERTREQIFEPFFTTKGLGKGTGLGLAIAYGIVKQHSGNITVHSEPGKGTTFNIYLPLIAMQAEETHAETYLQPAGGTETILLAEDDADVRTLTKTILRDFGYGVIEAVDGQDALEKFAANAKGINLLVLDVIMPRKSGKEVYDAVKAARPDIDVLFISGYTADIIHKKGVFEDGLKFLFKPVSPSELLRNIRAILDKAGSL